MAEEKLLVAVAPCIPPYMAAGIPGLDLSPEAIAADVVRAWNAGANLVHLHVWDEHGQPTAELTAFERTLRLIREQCDIVIEGATGGFNHLTPRERAVALQADIELASLNPGSVNYDHGVYINSPDDIAYWAREMHSRQIKPDIAIFESGMIANSLELMAQDWVDPPLLFTFVLGQKGAQPANPKTLLFLSELIPSGSFWGVIGHGGQDLRMSALSMNMGGHVRAGFEDNPYYQPGHLARNNAELIERLVRLAHEVGRPIASPTEVRSMLKLPPRRSH
jgi:3-keto-5-aminohexanoate cleavage enzyme